MAETTLPSALASGDVLNEQQWESWSLALKGLGITADNSGNPLTARALGMPVAVRGADANAAMRVVGSGASYTVSVGLWFVITHYFHAGAVTDQITPNGGAAITLSSIGAATASARRVCIVLGAGDQITMGAGSSVMGQLLTAPSDLTRVLQIVDNVTTYTVAASKALQLLHASPVGAATATGQSLTIDGVAMIGLPNAGEILTNGDAAGLAGWLKTGQVLAGSDGTDYLISGVLASV